MLKLLRKDIFMFKIKVSTLLLLILFILSSGISDAESDVAYPALIDYGATYCKSCQDMIPVLEDIKKSYGELLRVEFVDVNKYPEKTEKAGVELIPTQIIYDKNGKEVFRHEGYISKEDLVKILKDKKIVN